MIDLAFSPALILIFGALLILLAPQRIYKNVAVGLPLLTLASIWLASKHYPSAEIMGYATIPFQLSDLGRLFASAFCIVACGGVIYALNHFSRFELAFALLYAGSAVGVSLAGDFITLFIYWEMMTIAATAIIFAQKSKRSRDAGMRYALIHIFGGMCLLYGIVGFIEATGDTTLRAVALDTHYAWGMLIGFLISAGAPPLSAWIADAYPEASPGGAVFLCAFTTKAAVFALLSVFSGASILIWVGLYMIFYGILYALLENDMRRILAYSIVNQVGFMVVCCGIGTPLAINAAAAHAAVHIIYKGLLMMSAGSVLFVTGKRKCTELGGLYSSMKITTVCAIIGAISISAVPLTSGFSAKALVAESAQQANMTFIWFAFLIAAAGVFLHAGIKFPWFVFFNHKPRRTDISEAPSNMLWAMLLLAFICILVGVIPQYFYQLLPYSISYKAYTLSHIVGQLQLLLFSGIAFFMMLSWLKRTPTISLDFDWFYRKIPAKIASRIDPLTRHSTEVLTHLISTSRVAISHLFCRMQLKKRIDIPQSALFAVSFTLILIVLLFMRYAQN